MRMTLHFKIGQGVVMLLRDLLIDWRIREVAHFCKGRDDCLGHMSQTVREYWVDRLKCDPTEVAYQALREWRWRRNIFLITLLITAIACVGVWWRTGSASLILPMIGVMVLLIALVFLFLRLISTNTGPVYTFFNWVEDVSSSLDLFTWSSVDNLLGMEMSAIKATANERLIGLAGSVLILESRVKNEPIIEGELAKERVRFQHCLEILRHTRITDKSAQPYFDAARELEWVKKILESSKQSA